MACHVTQDDLNIPCHKFNRKQVIIISRAVCGLPCYPGRPQHSLSQIQQKAGNHYKQSSVWLAMLPRTTSTFLVYYSRAGKPHTALLIMITCFLLNLWTRNVEVVLGNMASHTLLCYNTIMITCFLLNL